VQRRPTSDLITDVEHYALVEVLKQDSDQRRHRIYLVHGLVFEVATHSTTSQPSRFDFQILETHQNTTLLQATIAVKPACSDYQHRPILETSYTNHTGMWQRKGETTPKWCSETCYYAGFENQSEPISVSVNRQLLQNVTLLFMGNSHLRNLFRCTADIVSESDSLQDGKYPCNRENLSDSNPPYRHCLSCENMVPIHRNDYTYFAKNLSVRMAQFWTVIWDANKASRHMCEAEDFQAKREVLWKTKQLTLTNQ
jgi:hypothetical protein